MTDWLIGLMNERKCGKLEHILQSIYWMEIYELSSSPLERKQQQCGSRLWNNCQSVKSQEPLFYIVQ